MHNMIILKTLERVSSISYNVSNLRYTSIELQCPLLIVLIMAGDHAWRLLLYKALRRMV